MRLQAILNGLSVEPLRFLSVMVRGTDGEKGRGYTHPYLRACCFCAVLPLPTETINIFREVIMDNIPRTWAFNL